MSEANKENCIEFLTGDSTVTVSFTSPRFCNRIKKLYEKNKEDFGYMVENNDNSICAKIPISWLRIQPNKKLSEEERQTMAERLAVNLAKGKE